MWWISIWLGVRLWKGEEVLTLSAPAKINWFLHIVRKRDDGYHDIVSLMQYVTLSDTLTMEHSDGIQVVSAQNIPQEENLVYKAAVLMRQLMRIKSGVRITLKKEIPEAAGLGGGSSDAASSLLGLSRLWNLNVAPIELAEMGKVLGSDVPFFFQGPLAMVEGRGEIVFPVRLRASYSLLLVKPLLAVSTAWAYAQLDVPSNPKVLTKKHNNITLFRQALENGDFSLLSSLQRNDLEPHVAKRYPVIDEIKEKLMLNGAIFSSMSGSGPTVFGVFRTDKEAAKAAEGLSPNWCRVVKTVAPYS
ncbi:MAG TPA: 4-(cytidine 5'-diphospho)-2-C-methyl-D-erythritol kinase [Nitrospiraceae bacterium]|jgi:4-diphosphocytidyl-2-C-methyl-D-erythritol kinase|nr:4-(cytidine 5'-diphospho)-2-C-methyl-D-erythritol kinase [Nitrospiraceae bacterium]